MSKPTPTPWLPDANGLLKGADGEYVVLSSRPFAIGFGNREGAKENSEFAYRAVNAFDDMLAMVELLERATLYQIGVDEQAGDAEGANMKRVTLSMVRAVIAKATQP